MYRYVICNFTKFECNQMYGYRKKLHAKCPFKIYVFSCYHGNSGYDTSFPQNMRSFIQVHTPTKFEVHSVSTFENHIFKFSLPLNHKLGGCSIFVTNKKHQLQNPWGCRPQGKILFWMLQGYFGQNFVKTNPKLQFDISSSIWRKLGAKQLQPWPVYF